MISAMAEPPMGGHDRNHRTGHHYAGMVAKLEMAQRAIEADPHGAAPHSGLGHAQGLSRQMKRDFFALSKELRLQQREHELLAQIDPAAGTKAESLAATRRLVASTVKDAADVLDRVSIDGALAAGADIAGSWAQRGVTMSAEAAVPRVRRELVAGLEPMLTTLRAARAFI